MSVEWTSVSINLISPVISFILGIISRTIFDIVLRKNPIRNFWSGCLASPVNIIVPSVRLDYIAPSHRAGYSSLNAAAKVESLLSLFTNVPENIRVLESKYAAERLEENIVLIGGPITNELTRRMMQDFDFPFSFRKRTLIDRYQNKEYAPKLAKDGSVLEDFALVLKITNPYNDRRSLVIIAGCFGYGTYSASLAVTNPKSLRIINQKVKSRPTGIVVKSYVIQGVPQRPFIIDVFEVKQKQGHLKG